MWSGKRILALGAAALLLLGGCAGDAEQAQEDLLTGAEAQTAKSYETYDLVPGDIVKKGELNLRVVYTQKQTLYAPDDGLFVDSVLVDRKALVKKGETIAAFHKLSSQAELEKIELALSRAEEEREEQLEDLEEALEIASWSGGTQWELAQLRYDRAKYAADRQIKQLQKEVDEARANFQPILLTAPYDCVINTVSYLHDQEEIDTSTAIVEISRASSMVLVGETGVNNFQYGNQVTVEYGKKKERHTTTGRVISTSVLLGDAEPRVCIQLDEPIEESQLELPSAKIEILQLQSALTVPRAAIQTENGSSYVQILVDNVAHKRFIIRGITVGTVGESHVVVLSGLKAGQQVIIH